MSILESFLAGKEARRVQDAAAQINAMQQYISQNGQAIMGGDQNALGQLAGFGQQGLQMAMGIQGDVQQRERQAQMDALALEDRAYGRQRDQKQDARADQQWEMQLLEYKKGLSAEQAAAEAASLENAAKMALTATSPEQWDQLATENGAAELVGQFDNREAVAARFMSMADVLKATGPQEGPEWRAATAEEAAAYGAKAGQISDKTGEFKRTPTEKNMVIESTPGGGFRLIEGEGAAGGGMKPSDPALMISSIDAILADPALETSTGMLSPLQYIPGTPQKRFQTRAKQLEGQAFLQAFESLKGAGQITEIEGQKATQAIGRLDTSQSADDYRQALTELREVLALGASRPPGWAEQNAAPGATPEAPPATPKRLRWNPDTETLE